jgi:hypothetical protein
MTNPPAPTVFSKGLLVSSAFLNTEIARLAEIPGSVVVWWDGTNYHPDNAIGGTTTPTTDASTALQAAINACP